MSNNFAPFFSMIPAYVYRNVRLDFVGKLTISEHVTSVLLKNKDGGGHKKKKR